MSHDIATGCFTFNIETKFFIEFLCLSIDFEYLQADALGLLLARRNNRLKQLAPDTHPLVMRMNNKHSYEQLPTPIFNMGIPNQLMFFVYQRNAYGIKVRGKITFLPLFIPAPYFRNIATHYQAIQFEDGIAFCLFGFPVRVGHDDEMLCDMSPPMFTRQPIQAVLPKRTPCRHTGMLESSSFEHPKPFHNRPRPCIANSGEGHDFRQAE